MRSVAHETTLRAITKLDTTVCLEKGKGDNSARPTRTGATALNMWEFSALSYSGSESHSLALFSVRIAFTDVLDRGS